MILWPLRDGARSGPPAVLVFIGARGMDATWSDLVPWLFGLALAFALLAWWHHSSAFARGRRTAVAAIALSAVALAARPAAIGGWDEQGWALFLGRFALCLAAVAVGAWASVAVWSQPCPARPHLAAAVAAIALAAVASHMLTSDASQPADRNVLEYKNVYYAAVAALLALAPGYVAPGEPSRAGAVGFAGWTAVLTGAAIALGDLLAGPAADHLTPGFYKPLSGWTLVAALTPVAWATAHLAGRARMWPGWALDLQDRLLRSDWTRLAVPDPLPATPGNPMQSGRPIGAGWQRVAIEAPAVVYLAGLHKGAPQPPPVFVTALRRRWSRSAPLLLMAPDGALVGTCRLCVLPWPALGRLVVHATWNGRAAPHGWRDAAAAVVDLGWRVACGAAIGPAWAMVEVEVDSTEPVTVEGDSWQLALALLASAVAANRPWPEAWSASGGLTADGSVTPATDLEAKVAIWRQQRADGIMWASPGVPRLPGVEPIGTLGEALARWPGNQIFSRTVLR